MFLLSVLPAFVALFIRAAVPESPAFDARRRSSKRAGLWETIQANWGLVALFGRADDGVQPVQPRHAGPLPDLPAEAAQFRSRDGELDHHRRQSRRDRRRPVFGFVSEKIGRVNAITIAALIALPALPLWAFSTTPVMLAVGAFVMQIAVQGAWGVIPAHLNELSPGAVRATLPAFVYQAGNFLASYNGPFQAKLAEANGGELRLCAGAGRRRRRGRADRRHPLQPGKARRDAARALTAARLGDASSPSATGVFSFATTARRLTWPVLKRVQERVVVLERHAAVGIAVRAEHVGVREQARASEDVAVADRREAQRRHAVEQLLARPQFIEVRRRRAAHAFVDVTGIVEPIAEARVRLQPRSVGQIDRARRDVVDGGPLVVPRRRRRAGEDRKSGRAIRRGASRAAFRRRIGDGGAGRTPRREQSLENVAIVGRRRSGRGRFGDPRRAAVGLGGGVSDANSAGRAGGSGAASSIRATSRLGGNGKSGGAGIGAAAAGRAASRLASAADSAPGAPGRASGKRSTSPP